MVFLNVLTLTEKQFLDVFFVYFIVDYFWMDVFFSIDCQLLASFSE